MAAIKKVLTSALILSAILGAMYHSYYKQHGQFYPAMRQFSRNNTAMLLTFLQWVCLVYLSTKGVIKLFFGNLRAIEVENVQQHFWLSITDTALILTIFHDELQKESVLFVTLFSSLLSIKILHWLFYDRVDFMETSPVITWTFRLRIICLSFGLLMVDAVMLWVSYQKIMQRKDYWMVFGLEYALLLTSSVHIFIKFILHSIDLACTSPWENKNSYMMIMRMIFTSFRLSIQLSFVYYLTKTVSFPLFAVRPVLVEAKILRNTFRSIIRSREAIKRLSRFPSVKIEDFTPDKDVTCIICHEDMVASDEASGSRNLVGECKRLPCGHIFHVSCLRSWFLRQQTCPICRDNVLTQTGVGAQPAGVAGPGNPANPGNAQQEAQVIQGLLRQIQNARNNIQRNPAGDGQAQGQNVQSIPTLPGLDTQNMVFRVNNSAGSQLRIPTNPPVPRPPVEISELMELSPSELRAMEGEESAALVKRIHHLRQVRSMCDATLTMMDQYHSVIGPQSSTVFTQTEGSTQVQEEAQSFNQQSESNPNELRQRRLEAFSQ